jgi:outer membrane protein TolC
MARVKQAYYRRAFAWSTLQTIDRNLALMNKLRRLAEIRYAAGKAMQQDVLKTQTQISILATRRLQMERERAAREAELESLLARRPGVMLPAPALLTPVAMETPLDALYAAARENSPLLRAGEKRIQRAELAVNLARKEVLPDYTVRAGYYNMGRMPDMYQFGVDIRLPLWFARKQRAMVTEKAQELAESQRNLEAEGRQLLFRIKDEFLAAQTAAQLTQLYAETVIPQASLTLESSLASYESGAVDFLAVFLNYQTVIEYEMNYYEELQNLHLALARLEELTAKELLR